jgi:hypothetical protein
MATWVIAGPDGISNAGSASRRLRRWRMLHPEFRETNLLLVTNALSERFAESRQGFGSGLTRCPALAGLVAIRADEDNRTGPGTREWRGADCF